MTVETKSAGRIAAESIRDYIRARCTLIWVRSKEERRARRLIGDAMAGSGYPITVWDCALGTYDLSGAPVGAGPENADPRQVMAAIRASEARGVWILQDLPAVLDPVGRRTLRSLVETLESAPLSAARAVVVVTPEDAPPPDLAGHAIVVDLPLPDRVEMAAILDAKIAVLPEKDPEGNPLRAAAAPNGTRDAAIDAALGLTEGEATAIYARSLVKDRKLDPARLGQDKRTIISGKGLEWWDQDPRGLDGIGGLDLAKAKLLRFKAAWGADARAYGLDRPNGLIVVGPPGTGKSLFAKCAATALAVPLIKIDFGAMRGKYQGESEGAIRGALKTIDAIGPCVVWADEIEKGLAGASGSGAADGGVALDAFGTFLTWMQERKGQAFVVATSNDVTKLPPELLRKGRFDAIFMVDLPNVRERVEILRVALKAKGRESVMTQGDLGTLSALTQGFSGAEIAALVPEAMSAAWADGKREINVGDLCAAARGTVPLSKTAPEKIKAIREWAVGKALPASSPEAVATIGAGGLDL